MGFLDELGLNFLWGKITARLSAKQDRLTGQTGQVAGFGQNGALQPQYLNFTVAGDGNPVGAVISFLGLNAPQGYLVCDGGMHAIEDYPELAGFFESQFGTKNHFGGDGETSFAVPDMRNLFLRGYHGDTEEVSAELGQRQEATEVPWVAALNGYGTSGLCNMGISKDPSRPDDLPHFRNNELENFDLDSTITTAIVGSGNNVFQNNPNTEWKVDPRPVPVRGKVRPVNMAVLYCIKAVSAESSRIGEYSTEEVPIGTWIDGKTVYRMVIQGTSGSVTGSWRDVKEIPNVENVVSLSFVIWNSEDNRNCGNDRECVVGYSSSTQMLGIYAITQNRTNQPFTALFEYTKTTD
ncbi:tail fiber protein [Acutalibacter sp. 1XD8-33]|uniref:phage tail protein n=1 Tax=Acutalibacter sp. 1XD8-33 TaxID=2320081 RepID=UPI000EA153D7|nr:phage tail protein [Acutalibacter sp. 1XD8-33]RKJ40216.1 tail fiber protein [Acutalibacter sp. 1XD8-33]